MKKVFAIAKKEIRDNLRDKRSVGMALLYPIFWPVLLGVMIVIGGKVFNIDFDKVTDLAVVGQDRAPNLIQYLHQNNIEVTAAPDNYQDAVLNAEIPVVLEITEEYGERLREGLPAPLKIYLSASDTDSSKAHRRISSILRGYNNSINQRRLLVRGIDVNLFDSIDVQEEDVSAAGERGQTTGLLVPVFCILSMLMGAFYLAIDVTAGEKERHSLEPLLSLPASRAQFALGKFIALFAFIMFSLIVVLLAFWATFNIIPADKLNGLRIGMRELLHTGFILTPLALLMAALLMTISSFTKSSKEAQTYLGILVFLPMIPFYFMMFKTIPTSTEVLATPLLSQFKLADKVFKDENIEFMQYVLSFGTTIFFAGLTFSIAIWLYKQDRILQS